MIVIVPSRGRPDNVKRLISAWHETKATATLLIVTDDDDPAARAYGDVIYDLRDNRAGVLWVTTSPMGMVGALNRYAKLYAEMVHDTHIIGFMGDDHIPRTPLWDQRIRDILRAGPGIVYCNDLLQGSNLPTQVFMSSGIIRALGHMAPSFQHLYVDNYWKQLGQGAECLTYISDVVIEHMHPVAGKAEWDDGYKRVNDGSVYASDWAALVVYTQNGYMRRDIETVRGVVRSGVEAV